MRPNSGASLATQRRFSTASWPPLRPRPCMKPCLTTCSQQQVSSTLSPRDTRYASLHYQPHLLNLLFSRNVGIRSHWFLAVLLQVTQNSGHGHTPNPAVHGGAHHHSPAVQPHGPSVVSGHSHTPAPQASAQGQQFQRLKVSLPLLLMQQIFRQTGREGFSWELTVWSMCAVLPYYRYIIQASHRLVLILGKMAFFVCVTLR